MISEATIIPGNEGLSTEAAEMRRREVFDPYHRRIDEIIEARLHRGQPTVLVALHSFTPVYAGIARPWHIGTLYHRDHTLPPLLLQSLRAEGDLVVGDNEPYAVSDITDYTIPVHGEMRGLVNTGIEIRQDLIGDQSGQHQWAERLARILRRDRRDAAEAGGDLGRSGWINMHVRPSRGLPMREAVIVRPAADAGDLRSNEAVRRLPRSVQRKRRPSAA